MTIRECFGQAHILLPSRWRYHRCTDKNIFRYIVLLIHTLKSQEAMNQNKR
ncbi:MAG TPA: hypothetical protein V6C71_23445 [Coleofasciculaceae cyanobacterium]